MKAVKEYLSDPRMLNDLEMAVTLEPIKEIRSIRLIIQDETANMKTAEKIEFLNKEAETFLAPMGKSLYYDLVSRGKLDSRMTVI